MNIAGIICEYNPLHNGHAFHISETRKQLGGNCGIICAMSGNFVQRGDFALFDKNARASAAVLCGADLVVELPTVISLSSAERFAEGGVRLLDALGICTHISFGCESGELGVLSAAACALSSENASKFIIEELQSGISYAAARQRALERITGDTGSILRNANDTLGVEYLRAMNRFGSQMKPVCVKRTGGEHDGKEGMSASAIRDAIFLGNNAWVNVPEKARKIFECEMSEGRAPVTMHSCETAILSKLRSMSRNDYKKLPDASEGLAGRLARFAYSEPSLEGVLQKTKTKRYTMSRLRRMVMCAYLGITSKDTFQSPRYIKVLAANERGCELIRRAKNVSKLPIITKPASALHAGGYVSSAFIREAKFTDMYVLARPKSAMRSGGSEYRTSPFICTDNDAIAED